MDDLEPTLRRRLLGARLRQVREQAGHSMTALAHALGWSLSRISRLESGSRGTGLLDLATLLGYCRVVGGQRDDILDLSRDSGSTTWTQHHNGQPPDELESLLLLESTAQTITSYHPTVVPPLLQTPDYVRALLSRSAQMSSTHVERYVQARAARQQRVAHNPNVGLRCYIPEPVLHAPVGDRQVITEQLGYLGRLAGRPRWSIHILPRWSTTEAFELVTYTDYRPLVYTEHSTTSLILEDATTIAAYTAILDQFATAALDREKSRDIILDLGSKGTK